MTIVTPHQAELTVVVTRVRDVAPAQAGGADPSRAPEAIAAARALLEA